MEEEYGQSKYDVAGWPRWTDAARWTDAIRRPSTGATRFVRSAAVSTRAVCTVAVSVRVVFAAICDAISAATAGVRRRNLPPARVHPRHRCRGMLRPRNNLLGCSSRRFPGNHSLCNNRRYRSNHNPCNGHLGRGKFHSKSRGKADRIAIPILRLVWRRLNRRITVSTCYPIESSISCSASYRCSSCSCPAFLGVLVPEVCAASSYWQ